MQERLELHLARAKSGGRFTKRICSQRESLKADGVYAACNGAVRRPGTQQLRSSHDSRVAGWQALLREGTLYGEPSGRKSEEGLTGRLNWVADTSGACDALRH